MQLNHHPRRKCVKLVNELDVGVFTSNEGTLHLVPKVRIRRAMSHARHLELVTRRQNCGLSHR